MKTLALGGAAVALYDDGLTVTMYPDGAIVEARAQDNDEYRQRARDLGYGDDTARMSREHEIAHGLLAQWLKLPHSPTLRGVALGEHYEHWDVEEAAVLALQKYARTVSVNIEELAECYTPS